MKTNPLGVSECRRHPVTSLLRVHRSYTSLVQHHGLVKHRQSFIPDVVIGQVEVCQRSESEIPGENLGNDNEDVCRQVDLKIRYGSASNPDNNIALTLLQSSNARDPIPRNSVIASLASGILV